MHSIAPETDFLTDSYSLENGGFCKWRGFGRTKNPPFSRFYCIINHNKLLYKMGKCNHKKEAISLLTKNKKQI